VFVSGLLLIGVALSSIVEQWKTKRDCCKTFAKMGDVLVGGMFSASGRRGNFGSLKSALQEYLRCSITPTLSLFEEGWRCLRARKKKAASTGNLPRRHANAHCLHVVNSLFIYICIYICQFARARHLVAPKRSLLYFLIDGTLHAVCLFQYERGPLDSVLGGREHPDKTRAMGEESCRCSSVTLIVNKFRRLCWRWFATELACPALSPASWLDIAPAFSVTRSSGSPVTAGLHTIIPTTACAVASQSCIRCACIHGLPASVCLHCCKIHIHFLRRRTTTPRFSHGGSCSSRASSASCASRS
jgi:hypothetical protein